MCYQSFIHLTHEISNSVSLVDQNNVEYNPTDKAYNAHAATGYKYVTTCCFSLEVIEAIFTNTSILERVSILITFIHLITAIAFVTNLLSTAAKSF